MFLTRSERTFKNTKANIQTNNLDTLAPWEDFPSESTEKYLDLVNLPNPPKGKFWSPKNVNNGKNWNLPGFCFKCPLSSKAFQLLRFNHILVWSIWAQTEHPWQPPRPAPLFKCLGSTFSHSTCGNLVGGVSNDWSTYSQTYPSQKRVWNQVLLRETNG